MRFAALLLLLQTLFAVALYADVPAPLLCWKREGLDSAGRIAWTDSVYYDSAGKPLFERRRDSRDSVAALVRHWYGSQGLHLKSHHTLLPAAARDSIACLYDSAGTMLFWDHTAELPEEFLSAPHHGEFGDSSLHMDRYEYGFGSAGGRCTRAARRSIYSDDGSPETECEFVYDSLGRHVETFFHQREGEVLGRDSVRRDSAGRPLEWRLRDAMDRIVQRVTWEYAPDGTLRERAEYRDSGAPASKERFHWRTADSLPRAIGARSRFAGPRRGAACASDWREAIDFGFEPRSLAGLALAPAGKGKRGKRIRRFSGFAGPSLFARESEEDGCRGSESMAALLACRRDAEAREVKAVLKPSSACLRAPRGDCADSLIHTALGLLDSANEAPGSDAALDTVISALHRGLGLQAEPLLLACLKWDGQQEDLASAVLDSLLAWRIDRAYAAFMEPEKPPRLPPAVPKGTFMPDSSLWTADLRAAWAYRQRVLAIDSGAPLFRNWFGEDAERLLRLASDYLRTGDAGIVRAIEADPPDGMVFDFEGGHRGPYARIRLLTDLEAGRLGAVLRQTSAKEMLKRLLTPRGLDWEQYLLGYLADSSLHAYRTEYLLTLAREGSPRTVRALLALHRPGDPDGDYGHVFASVLASLILPPGAKPVGRDGRTPVEVRGETLAGRDTSAPALPEDIRAQALARLLAQIDRRLYDCPLEDILPVVGVAEFSGREAYLARIAAVPNGDIRDTALAYLGARAAGVKGLLPLEPLRFRLTTGGKPLVGAKIRLGAEPERSREDWRNSEFCQTDKDGKMELKRSDYLRLRARGPVLWIGSRDTRNPGDPVFSIPLRLAENPTALIRVEIPLRRVVITPVLPKGFFPFQEAVAHIRILPALEGAKTIGYSSEWSDSLVFRSWGDGAYSLELSLPGLRRELIGPIRVAGADVRLRPALARGSDVSARIVPPDSCPSGFVSVSVSDAEGRIRLPDYGEHEPRQDGLWYADEPAEFPGLPPGHYVLRVQGSREVEAALEADDKAQHKPGRGRRARRIESSSRVGYRALSLPFRVTGSGPDEMDLGDLRLQPEVSSPLPPARNPGSP